MTTELTLREKVLEACRDAAIAEDVDGKLRFLGASTAESLVAVIADLLSATGAPAYCRVADDLRGVVREEGVRVVDYIRPYLQSSGEVVFGKPAVLGGRE